MLSEWGTVTPNKNSSASPSHLYHPCLAENVHSQVRHSYQIEIQRAVSSADCSQASEV